jgi:DNA-binding Lrp family transcriptional regulator
MGTLMAPARASPRVDATDIRILRAMGVQPYGPIPRPPACLAPRAVGKALGLSPEAVRDRIQRMEQGGVLCGYEVFPNVRHLGLTSSLLLLRFADEAQADAAAQRIEALEGLTATYSFMGPLLGVDLAHRGSTDFERKVRLLKALAPEAQVEKFMDVPMPPVKRALTNLDWRIVQALRGDALKAHREVAAQVGVSARTVKRHFDRMAKEGSFFVIPMVDPSAVPGLILFELVLHFEPAQGGKAWGEVQALLDANMVCMDRPSEPQATWLAAGLYAQGIGEVDRLRKAAAAVPGVQRAEPFILRASTEDAAWLDEAIATQVEAGAARPARARAKA